MGLDWRPYLEKKTENGWVPYWEPSLSGDWYDNLLCNGYFQQASYLLAGTTDEDISYAKIEEHLELIPLDEVKKRFNDNPGVYWHWHEHKTILKSRNGDWFNRLFDLLGYFEEDSNPIMSLNIPEDVSYRVFMEYKAVENEISGLGVMRVSDMLSHQKLKYFDKVKWLKENIDDPKTTRLIFWFS